jgi:hypothetical protein
LKLPTRKTRDSPLGHVSWEPLARRYVAKRGRPESPGSARADVLTILRQGSRILPTPGAPGRAKADARPYGSREVGPAFGVRNG